MTTDPANADHAGLRCVDQLITHYGESHQNPRNEPIHFIAIPLIMLSLVGMLFALHPFVAYAFVVASMVLWSALTVAVVFAMGLRALSISATIFVAAWVLQFIGHKIEGKKPSFFEDIQYLWVGPMFVLSKLFGKLGIRW